MRLALDTGSGPALVLVCALLCDEDLYRDQLPTLARRHRVLVAVPDGDTGLEQQAGSLAQQLADRGIRRFSLAGVSMGGYLAQALLAQHPERITALALIDTRCRADAPAAREGRLATLEALDQGRFEGELARLLPRLLCPQSLSDARITDRVLAMARRLGSRVWARQLQALLERPDTRPVLAAWPGPALVLCGAQDSLTPPEEHREMAGLLKGGRFQLLPGNVGHLSPLEAPRAVAEALDSFFGSGA
jgi:pimeloyl-ACP methyl ester carboxylesterase